MNILNKTSHCRNLVQTSLKKKAPFSVVCNFKNYINKISLSNNFALYSNKNYNYEKKNNLHYYKINCFSSSKLNLNKTYQDTLY